MLFFIKFCKSNLWICVHRRISQINAQVKLFYSNSIGQHYFQICPKNIEKSNLLQNSLYRINKT